MVNVKNLFTVSVVIKSAKKKKGKRSSDVAARTPGGYE